MAAIDQAMWRRTSGEKAMADLKDREKAMEDQYFQDAERSIRVKSRSDRLLAKWVAALIGRNDVAGYTDEISDVRLTGDGDDGVLSKALSDIQGAGHNLSKQDVAAKMRELIAEATIGP
jgi:hypothetical protein